MKHILVRNTQGLLQSVKRVIAVQDVDGGIFQRCFSFYPTALEYGYVTVAHVPPRTEHGGSYISHQSSRYVVTTSTRYSSWSADK